MKHEQESDARYTERVTILTTPDQRAWLAEAARRAH
jgi:hypothetical protein